MGLIFIRNPIAYPGGAAGINLAHPASYGIRYSGVAQNGNLTSLMNGSRATVNGTITATTNATGPNVVNNTSTSFLSVPGTNETPTAVTFAAIYTPTTSNSSAILFSNDGNQNAGVAYVRFYVNSLAPSLLVAGSAISSSITLALGVPYFIAASFSGANDSFVVVNLITGKLSTKTAAQSLVIGTTANSLFTMGGLSVATTQMNGNLAAIMYSINNYLSLPRLIAWGHAPWEFWYPPGSGPLLFASVKSSAVVAAHKVRALVLA